MTYKKEEFHIQASKDQLNLFCQAWKTGDSNKVLIINHGFGEHSGRYQNLVQFFEGSDISFYAFDMRGHGRSEGKRGHADSFDDYVQDLADFVNEVKMREKNKKLFLLGHSMGGVVALRYAQEGINQDNLTALILSSPALRVKMSMGQKIQKWIGQGLAKMMPTTTVEANLDLNYLTHDQNVVSAYAEDELVHGKISLRMGTELFKQEAIVLSKAGNLKLPVFLMHGEEDGIADIGGTLELYNHLRYRNKRLLTYPGLYHELMNELPEDRDRVLADLQDFIDSIMKVKAKGKSGKKSSKKAKRSGKKAAPKKKAVKKKSASAKKKATPKKKVAPKKKSRR